MGIIRALGERNKLLALKNQHQTEVTEQMNAAVRCNDASLRAAAVHAQVRAFEAHASGLPAPHEVWDGSQYIERMVGRYQEYFAIFCKMFGFQILEFPHSFDLAELWIIHDIAYSHVLLQS